MIEYRIVADENTEREKRENVLTTKLYQRLPPDSGTSFEGVEKIKIKSRENISILVSDFVDFCIKNAKKPACRIILGDWGEGKSELYNLHIKPIVETRKSIIFKTLAKTISNGYEHKDVQRLNSTTQLESLHFLISLFNSIKEISNNENIPSVKDYNDAKEYFLDVIKRLSTSAVRVFIFIDEFEDLLQPESKISKIITGIKQLINTEELPALGESGEFSGLIHFFISCTPDAYYRLKSREGFDLTSGGIGRREAIINLEPILKDECIDFFWGLMKYSWEEKLPTPLPIASGGILETLYKVTQGNLGNMVSIFTRLLQHLTIDDEKMEIAYWKNVKEFLLKTQINLYGQEVKAIDEENYKKILEYIGTYAVSREIIDLLLFELEPLSVDSIVKKLRRHKEDIKNAITIINNELQNNFNIRMSIFKLNVVESGKTFNDILKIFDDFIKEIDGKKNIVIETHIESIDAFKDKVTYFGIEDQEIVQRLYLPTTPDNIKTLFGGEISDEITREISRKIDRNKLCSQEEVYILSPQLLEQIFPSPIPKDLGFVLDKNIRQELWKDIQRNFDYQYNTYMPKAFIKLIKETRNFIVDNHEKEFFQPPRSIFCELLFNVGLEQIKINVLFCSVNGEVLKEHIQTLKSYYDSCKNPPVNLICLCYTTEINNDASEEIEIKGLGETGQNIILYIHLHMTIIKKLLFAYSAMSKYKEKIDNNSYKEMLEKIILNEIQLDKKIENWLKRQEELGWVITDLKTGEDIGKIADGLRFYINFIEEKEKPEEIYKKNKIFDKYRLYGQRRGLALFPKIDEPKFIDISRDLEVNKFLKKNKDGKYEIDENPIEKNIYYLIEKFPNLSATELEKFFIMKAKRRNLLENVFLDILKYKGKIHENNNRYQVKKRKEAYSDLNEKYRNFTHWFRENEKWIRKYGHICMFKKKRGTLFSLYEYQHLVDDFYRYLTEKYNELSDDVVLQKCHLIVSLIEYFNESIISIVNEANSRIVEISERLNEKIASMEREIGNVLDSCKIVGLKYSLNNIEEYKYIIQSKKEYNRLINFSYDEVKAECLYNEDIQEFDKNKKKDFEMIFDFESCNEYYFNVALYLFNNLDKMFDENIQRFKESLKKIKDMIDKFQNNFYNVSRKLNSKEFDKEINPISHNLICYLKYILKGLEKREETSEVMTYITLNKVKKDLEYAIDNDIKILETINRAFKDIDTINEYENKYSEEVKNIERLKDNIKNVFNINEYQRQKETLLKEINKEMEKDLLSKIQELLNRCNEKNIEHTISTIITIINERLYAIRNIKIQIDEEYEKYKRDILDSYHNMLDLLDILKKRNIKDNGSIENKINLLIRDFPKQFEFFHNNMSAVKIKKENIRNEIYGLASAILSKDDYEIINALIEMGKGKEWIPLQALYNYINSIYQISKENYLKSIEKLRKEKFLIGGVRLL
ncbi:MAG: hypothetical protein QXH42_07770 [Thermoplasmata archaeon]